MTNLCTKVTVRKRPIKNGQTSLYLDFYPPIRNPKTGKLSQREFARPNEEWADKADYIEFLYTDEAEHQGEIERLWENRRKRLAK